MSSDADITCNLLHCMAINTEKYITKSMKSVAMVFAKHLQIVSDNQYSNNEY